MFLFTLWINLIWYKGLSKVTSKQNVNFILTLSGNKFIFHFLYVSRIDAVQHSVEQDLTGQEAVYGNAL